MESGSIFPDLGEVQNGEHFNTSMSSSGVATAKRKRLTNLEKRDIVHRLSLNFSNGKLQRGSINTLATDFGVSRITIYTIWKDVQQAIKDGKMELPSVDRKYKGGNMTYVFDLEKPKKLSRLGIFMKISARLFLLILDDVWNEEAVKWDDLRNSLLEIGGDKGSCILVTTRKQEVIDAIRSCVSYWPEILSQDESYDLFKKIAFSDGGVLETEAFATLGRSMVKRLDNGVSNIKPTTLKRAFERVQLLCARADILLHVLPYLTHLTVLVINADKNPVALELPFSLRKMKYLKHLDISHFKLPADITELYNLQTLRVGDPDEFPKRFSNLINLRHLYITQKYGKKCMYNGIERLTSLQTLPHFVVSKDQNCLIGQLGGLKNLRGEVRLYSLEEVANIEEARKARLCEKSSIQCLKLNWRNTEFSNSDSEFSDKDGSNEDEMEDKEYNDQDVMEGLEPHPNLETLKIVDFKGKKFASWITMMLNLVKITLRNCNRCEVLPPLGHLPKLMEIEIKGMSNVGVVGDDFCGGQSTGASSRSGFPQLKRLNIENCPRLRKITASCFPSLKYLYFQDLPSLEEWEGAVMSTGASSQSGFPKLETLGIRACPRLRKIPKSYFPSLKELMIDDLESDTILGTMCRYVSSLTSLSLVSIGDGGEGDSSSFSNMECMINNSLSLTELVILDCNGLKCLTLCSSLEFLKICYCPHLTSINVVGGSAGLTSIMIGNLPISLLEGLHLYGWEKVKSIALFEQLLFTAYPALTVLGLHDFEGLKALPDSIAKLPSLRKLSILGCNNLESLPAFEESHTLQTLYIVGCPVLRQRCRKGQGPEWFKIQYIPRIIWDHQRWQ
ncbi:hypothetical protein ACET3Z_026323 [Daucus carota]